MGLGPIEGRIVALSLSRRTGTVREERTEAFGLPVTLSAVADRFRTGEADDVPRRDAGDERCRLVDRDDRAVPVRDVDGAAALTTIGRGVRETSTIFGLEDRPVRDAVDTACRGVLDRGETSEGRETRCRDGLSVDCGARTTALGTELARRLGFITVVGRVLRELIDVPRRGAADRRTVEEGCRATELGERVGRAVTLLGRLAL